MNMDGCYEESIPCLLNCSIPLSMLQKHEQSKG